MTSPKLTPAQIKALEVLDASGDDYLPSWNIPGPIAVLDRLCQNRLIELRDRTMMTQPTQARITATGRQVLASIRAAEAAKDASVKAKPLSVAEIDALRVASDNDGILQCVVSGTWSTSHGRTGSFQSRTINLLIGRGLLKKLDADTAQLTDAGRDALAKIKEAANG
jgi:hypothetical protein